MPYHTIHVIFWTRFPKSSFKFAMSEQLLSSTLPHQKHQWPVAPGCFWMCRFKTHAWRIPSTRPTRPTLSTFFLPGMAPFQVDQRLLFDPHSCSMVADPHLSRSITHELLQIKMGWKKTTEKTSFFCFGGMVFGSYFSIGFFSPNEISIIQNKSLFEQLVSSEDTGVLAVGHQPFGQHRLSSENTYDQSIWDLANVTKDPDLLQVDNVCINSINHCNVWCVTSTWSTFNITKTKQMFVWVQGTRWSS